MSLNVRTNVGNQQNFTPRDLDVLTGAASSAYGSRITEGKSGGNGYVGMLNGRVVKFCTHRSERKAPATQAMLRSCDKLRSELYRIASSLTLGANERTRFLADIRKKLGINAQGEPAEPQKDLLSRQVVAAVMSKISEKTGIGYLSLRAIHTMKDSRFETVAKSDIAQEV